MQVALSISQGHRWLLQQGNVHGAARSGVLQDISINSDNTPIQSS